MKRLKRVGVLLLGGFVAFAPPGTMILLGSLALMFLGKFWLLAGVLCVALLTAVWLMLKRRAIRRRWLRAPPSAPSSCSASDRAAPSASSSTSKR